MLTAAAGPVGYNSASALTAGGTWRPPFMAVPSADGSRSFVELRILDSVALRSMTLRNFGLKRYHGLAAFTCSGGRATRGYSARPPAIATSLWSAQGVAP